MPSKANTAVPKKSGYFFQPATIGRLWGSGIFWRKKQTNKQKRQVTSLLIWKNFKLKSKIIHFGASQQQMCVIKFSNSFDSLSILLNTAKPLGCPCQKRSFPRATQPIWAKCSWLPVSTCESQAVHTGYGSCHNRKYIGTLKVWADSHVVSYHPL